MKYNIGNQEVRVENIGTKVLISLLYILLSSLFILGIAFIIKLIIKIIGG